jgi:hypothetical protein
MAARLNLRNFLTSELYHLYNLTDCENQDRDY